MSSKRRKSHHGSRTDLKSKKEDGQAEVFVLPPNILEKLGINLKNVDKTVECPTEIISKTDTPSTNNISRRVVETFPKVNDKYEAIGEVRDTSILDTAILMKESILLSPTCVAASANISTEELEISNIVESGKCLISNTMTDIYTEAINQNLIQNNVGLNTSAQTNYAFPDSINLSSCDNMNQANEVKNIQHIKKIVLSPIHDSQQVTVGTDTTNVVKIPTRAISTDEHTDEAYLSDCSNSNLGPLETTEIINYIPENNSFNFSSSNEHTNKISVINEEILSQTQLKEIKRLHSPKVSDLIPMSLDSVLKEKKNNSRDDNIAFLKKPYESSKTVVLFDDQGNVIQTVANDVSMDIDDSKIDASNNIMNECLKGGQHMLNKKVESEEQTAEHGFGDSIDMVVTDMDMHLNENEDILENFVNEITSNESNEILEKIEKTEKESLTLEKSLNINNNVEILPIVTNINSSELTPDTMVVNWLDSNDTSKPNDNIQSNNKRAVEDNSSAPDFIKCSIANDYIDNVSATSGNNKNFNTHNKDVEGNSTVNDADMTEIDHNDDYNKNQHNKDYESTLSKSNVQPNRKISLLECHTSQNIQIETNIPAVSRNSTKSELALIENDVFIPVDKVQKIAMYLSQFAKTRDILNRTKIRSANKKDTPTKSAKWNGSTSKLHIQGVEKPGGPEESEIKNKKITSVLKTYSNSKKKCNNASAVLASVTTVKNKLEMLLNTENREIDYNIAITDISSRTQEFCLCDDFGRLENYDSECLSEHIHFWEHKPIECNRELLFSIYSDGFNIDFNTKHFDDIEESSNINQESQTLVDSVCWNAFENKNVCKSYDIGKHVVNDDTTTILTTNARDTISDTVVKYKIHVMQLEHVDNCKSDAVGLRDREESVLNNFESTSTKSNLGKHNNIKLEPVESNYNAEYSKHIIISERGDDTIVTKEGESSTTKKTDNENSLIENNFAINQTPEKKAKKRKMISPKISIGGVNTSESSIKKSVKCGVCAHTLAKTEWDEHAAQEHCFIAWKAGTLIDFGDPKLIENLTAKVNDKKRLKCPFCRNEHKNVKKFLTHVEECLKGKNQADVSSDVTMQVQTSDTSQPTQALKDIERVTIPDEVTIICSSQTDSSSDVTMQGETSNTSQPTEAFENDESAVITEEVTATLNTDIIFEEKTSDTVKLTQSGEDQESRVVKDVAIIICNVCKDNLPSSEWMDHIAQKHNYIAWKDGERLDLEDPELLKNLNAKIKGEKCLICPICSNEYKTVKKFLTHVGKCSETKNQVNNSLTVLEETKDSNEQTQLKENEATVTSGNEVYVICGVCKNNLLSSNWMDHIAHKHNYIAWKDGDYPLDLEDENDIRHHLTKIIKQIGDLKCSRCGLVRKYAKLFLTHLEICKDEDKSTNSRETNQVSESVNVASSVGVILKCGVCGLSIEQSAWYDHIGKEHAYLAWEEGQTNLDVNNQDLVYKHLYTISKTYGGLDCNKCGRNRKYVKSYLQHIQNCEGIEVSLNETVDSINREGNISKEKIQCGVCQTIINSENWIPHIQMVHNYLAWKAGESMNFNNKEELRNHLDTVLRESGNLICSKCNVVQKSVKSYLKHIETCSDQNKVVCALCSKQTTLKQWSDHKMNKHYNVAWFVGETPIDLKNSSAVDKLIKEYKLKIKKLVCHNCGISRVSNVGFYAHVIVCGKSEEEADMHRKLCQYCNKKYLCVYENQHMTYHKEQEMNKEKRLREAEARHEVKKVEIELTPGRRQAAQKAKTVIEKYQKDINHYTHSCPCGFGTDSSIELEKHKCSKAAKDFSDSDESVQLEGSEEESDDSHVDSDVSNEEEETTRKRIREYIPASAKIRRFPFTPNNIDSYLNRSGEEYCAFHFKSTKLFSEWRINTWDPVPDDQLSNYLPSLEESCHYKHPSGSWRTYKRFEGKNLTYLKSERTHTLFAGGCIQSISWVPPVVSHEDSFGHYLAVIAHRGADNPELEVDHMQLQPGLIQIWDFGHFDHSPKFAMGLAHDYGVAWGMDWCPSGARDPLPDVCKAEIIPRLGLLAVAFSCGTAYIFSVPYPCTIVNNDKLIYKLKPLVELRLNTSFERKIHQATSIRWSPSKKHSEVLVGYSDGSMGFFDLNTESPLLKTKENDMTVIFPYHDNRVLNTCITGVDMYPSMDSDTMGSVCASAPTGAVLLAQATARPSTQKSSLSCCDAKFHALWPSVVLGSEDCGAATNAINEVEWWGGGRRLGAAAGAGAARCGRCARTALAAHPHIALLRRHPANDAAPRRIVGIFQLSPLGKTQKKLKNDNLQTKIEPWTYEEAIKKYGIEVQLDMTILKRTTSVRELHPERFPLSDVTSMAFCPSPNYHHKLAVGMHAGIVFVINVE